MAGVEYHRSEFGTEAEQIIFDLRHKARDIRSDLERAYNDRLKEIITVQGELLKKFPEKADFWTRNLANDIFRLGKEFGEKF